MSALSKISPTGLRDYAKSKGWELLAGTAHDRIYVMQHPDHKMRQLIFPMDTTAPGYENSISRMVSKLADIEARDPRNIISSLLQVNDDGISFRITAPDVSTSSLPLEFAKSVVDGAGQIFMAAACTVLKPRTHHPRLSRSEAEKLLEAAQFRHTQPGSFILNVSCPVNALEYEAPLLPGEEIAAPFVRRTTWTINKSLSELITAIETDTVGQLIDSVRASQAPLLSSNFCEAITYFQDDHLHNSLEVDIQWSPVIPLPPHQATFISKSRIQNDYFPRIEEVRRELRKDELAANDTFVGTVERLLGEMDTDGKRAGEVVLSVLLKGGEKVYARVNLSAAQYAIADDAHMKNGAYVKVAGRLNPGRQPRLLNEITAFDLLST